VHRTSDIDRPRQPVPESSPGTACHNPAIGTASGTIGTLTTAPAYDNSLRIGYARVSTRAQEHQAQLDALAAAHCREIITETASTRGDRPGLRKASTPTSRWAAWRSVGAARRRLGRRDHIVEATLAGTGHRQVLPALGSVMPGRALWPPATACAGALPHPNPTASMRNVILCAAPRLAATDLGLDPDGRPCPPRSRRPGASAAPPERGVP